MKFSNFFLAATMLFSFTTVQASEAKMEDTYASKVAIESILRTVLMKKLVKSSEARETLKAALETNTVEVGTMSCERAAESDYCSIQIFVKDDPATDEAEETLFGVDVRLNKGSVISAKFNLIAG